MKSLCFYFELHQPYRLKWFWPDSSSGFDRYFDEKLKAIDWAESSVGPREADIARTLNFIVDTTDYEDALFTTEREVFIKE